MSFRAAGASTRGSCAVGDDSARVDRSQTLRGVGGGEATAITRHQYLLRYHTGGCLTALGGYVLDIALFEVGSRVIPPGTGCTIPSESARLESAGSVGEIVLPIFSNEYGTIITKGLLIFLVYILGGTT